MLVEEFWVPATCERADLAVVGEQLWGFEIKSSRDSLRRLPRQVEAFSRLFDHCTAVLATRHLGLGAELVPNWWGVIDAGVEADDPLTWLRRPNVNPGVDMELLVQLLWRDEAARALGDLGIVAPPQLGRRAMWRLLLAEGDAKQLQERVRAAILTRDPEGARIPTRRFGGATAAVAAR